MHFAIEFFEKTRARYLALAESDGNCVVINAEQAIDKVHADILAALESFYQQVNL